MPPNVTDELAAVRASSPRIFPLQLSPLENMMVADDRPAYPMTFFVQLRLLGQVSEEAFVDATRDALERHPLLRSIIALRKANRPCWVEATGHEPLVDWAAEGTPIGCERGEAMDPTQELGVRIWIRQGAERATVLFQFHHANSDGTGAYRFIGDVLAGYGMRTGAAENRPTYGDLDPQLLRNRTRNTLNLALGPQRGFRRSALREGWRVVSRRPARVAPPRNVAIDGRVPDFPGFLSCSFDRGDHRQLRETAERQGVFLNDLLLRDLFLTLAQWNERQRGRGRRRPICIMMPVDLRTAADYLMPSGNMTGYTFLTRSRRDFGSPDKLLEGIRQQTAAIKHERTGAAWADMAYGASTVRGLLPFLLARNLCFATAVLSNAADPSRRFTATFARKNRQIICGDTILEEINGVPPLRRNTRAIFSISQYGNQLAISLRCDPHYFRVEDTRELLRMYREQLAASAGLGA
jgi:hypothetical protein